MVEDNNNLFGLYVKLEGGGKDVDWEFLKALGSGVKAGKWLNPMEVSSGGDTAGALLLSATKKHYPDLLLRIHPPTGKTAIQLTQEAKSNYTQAQGELLSVVKRAIAGSHYSVDEFFMAFNRALPVADLDLRDEATGSTVLHLLVEHPDLSYEVDQTTQLDPIEMVLARGMSLIETDALGRTPISIAANTQLDPHYMMHSSPSSCSTSTTSENHRHGVKGDEKRERDRRRRSQKLLPSRGPLTVSRRVVHHFHRLARSWIRLTGDLFWRLAPPATATTSAAPVAAAVPQSLIKLCQNMVVFHQTHNMEKRESVSVDSLACFIDENERGKAYMRRFHTYVASTLCSHMSGRISWTRLPSAKEKLKHEVMMKWEELWSTVASFLPYNGQWAANFSRMHNLCEDTLLSANEENGLDVTYDGFADDVRQLSSKTVRWLTPHVSSLEFDIVQRDWVNALLSDWDALLTLQERSRSQTALFALAGTTVVHFISTLLQQESMLVGIGKGRRSLVDTAVTLIMHLCELGSPKMIEWMVNSGILSSLVNLFYKRTQELMHPQQLQHQQQQQPQLHQHHRLPTMESSIHLMSALSIITKRKNIGLPCLHAANLLRQGLMNYFATILTPASTAPAAADHKHSPARTRAKRRNRESEDEKATTTSGPQFMYGMINPSDSPMSDIGESLIRIANSIQNMFPYRHPNRESDHDADHDDDDDDDVWREMPIPMFGRWFGVIGNLLKFEGASIQEVYLKLLQSMLIELLKVYHANGQTYGRDLVNGILIRYLAPDSELMVQITRTLEMVLSVIGTVPMQNCFKTVSTIFQQNISYNAQDDLLYDAMDNALSGRDICRHCTIATKTSKSSPLPPPPSSTKDLKSNADDGGGTCVRRLGRACRSVLGCLLDIFGVLAKAHSIATEPLTTTPRLLHLLLTHAVSIYDRKYPTANIQPQQQQQQQHHHHHHHKREFPLQRTTVAPSEEREFYKILQIISHVVSGPKEQADSIFSLQPLRLLMSVCQNDQEPIEHRQEAVYAMGNGLITCSPDYVCKLWQYSVPEMLHTVARNPNLHLRLGAALIQMIVDLHEHFLQNVHRQPHLQPYQTRLQKLQLTPILEHRQWNTQHLSSATVQHLLKDIEYHTFTFDSLFTKTKQSKQTRL